MRIDKRDMGRRVKTARLKRELTQEDLAAVIGITPTHISHIENGKGGGSLDTFIAIMNTLDLTPNELFCGVVDNTDPQLFHETVEILEKLPPARVSMLNRQLAMEVEVIGESDEKEE